MTPAPSAPRPRWPLLLLVLSLAACGGPRTQQQRQKDGERLTDEAAVLLHEAERELQKLEPERAEPRLAQARQLLAHPDVDLSPEAEMLRSQVAELQARIPAVREARERKQLEDERKQLEAAADKQRDQVVQAMADVSSALEALDRPDVGPTQAQAVLAATAHARKQLEQGQPLEASNDDYAASARRFERRLEQADARARLMQRLFDFTAGPLAASREAEALEKKARRERDPAARLALYTEARARVQRCDEDAQRLLSEAPELARASVTVEGRPTTLQAAASGCKARAGALHKTLLKLEKTSARKGKKKK